MDHTFQVVGMSCSHCEMAIKKAILRIAPEANIDIDLDTGKVKVHSTKTREALALAIADEGYRLKED